ncbi:MAG TPA: primosomal protein N' [Solirubrobacteraceae bacterium]|nr:primosomal protein N' [Solirubrobacteraceae bacterium]
MIAQVQPLTRTRAVRGTFDYRLGDALNGTVTVGSVLRIRFGRQRTLGVVTGLSDHSELQPEKLSEPDGLLDAALTPELVALAHWMAREYCSTPARALSLMLAPGAAQGRGAKRVLTAELTDAGRAALHSDGEIPAPRLTDAQRELLGTLERAGPTTASELGTAALRRLEGRGLVAIGHGIRPRRPAAHAVGSASASAPPLTADQQTALDEVLRAIAGDTFTELLLHGVTGSGKTEVYLGAVEAVLAAGRTAIVLVPEIALTPQTLWRFQSRFGDVVAVLHSALTQGERHDEWMRLRRGQARVCVGPRSAVLAPLERIGLIVVDEEHEGSYKHEGDPRYDARTVACRRALKHGATLVLGSATPRPESVHGLRRLRLPERVDGRPMPPVRLLDMRSSHHPLHPDTRMALADLRQAGGKAILLLNRRGWSNFLSCRSCGRVWLCPNCEVALVLHRHGSFVACHHCGHRERVPDRCPQCASVSVARHGAGTERIEHELREGLGDDCFPIFRLDADAATLRARARTLQAFQAARAGVLVGTQMVAKGHDFPDVSLGVVIDADQTLRFPDFRAEERTFSLVTQLAGRTGRGASGADPGDSASSRVLVQTLAPEARSLRFAAEHDSDGFVADELRRRRALHYPPFASLIRVVCSAESEPAAASAATQIHERIVVDGAAVLGPAPLFRLRGRFRSQVFVKAGDRASAIEAVGAAVDVVAPKAARHGVAVSVDVDPV